MMTSFPALDEEPPPPGLRSRARRAGLVLAVVVVLAGAGVGGWVIDNSVTGGGGGSSGRLLVLTDAKFLALAQPDGARAVPFTQFGPVAGGGGWVSSDGRTLLTDAGDTVTLRDGKPVSHSTALYTPLASTAVVENTGAGVYNSSGIISSPAPFADGGADVVFATPQLLPNGEYSSLQTASIVATRGGKARSLGVVDEYVGDPLQAAAFVTVPAPGQAGSTADLTDSAIEHRVAGGPATTVVTVAQVAKDVGLAAAPQISLGIFPDPTGKALAVSAWDVRVDRGLGVLVYTRTGKLVAHTAATAVGPLNWNPAGTKLLFDTGHGAALWTPGGSIQQVPTPANASLIQSCVWSPDGSQAVCRGYPGRGQRTSAWVDIDLAKGTAHSYPPAGVPLLWLK